MKESHECRIEGKEFAGGYSRFVPGGHHTEQAHGCEHRIAFIKNRQSIAKSCQLQIDFLLFREGSGPDHIGVQFGARHPQFGDAGNKLQDLA